MTPIELYANPATRRMGWWRPVAGGLTILAFWMAISLVVLAIYAVWKVVETGDPELGLAEMAGLAEGGTPERILVMLVTFGGIWVGIFLALAFFHGQEFPTIFAPNRKRRPGGFVAGLVLSLCFLGPTIAVAMMFATPVRSELSIQTWALLLIPMLPLIFLQATGEELIFRGYLLQQLRARFASPWIWAFLPAFFFGCLHVANAPTALGSFYYVSITTVMGLIFAVLVWRSGSIWSAAGLHVGNNAVGLTVIGPDGVLSGTQLWVFPKDDMDVLFPVDLILATIVLAIVVSPVGRIFGDGRRREDTPDAETFG